MLSILTWFRKILSLLVVGLPLLPVIWSLWLQNFIDRARQGTGTIAPELPPPEMLSPALKAEYNYLWDLLTIAIISLPIWLGISLIWLVWTRPKWWISALVWLWFIGAWTFWWHFPSKEITGWFFD